MKRTMKLFVCLLLVSLICTPFSQAGLVNYKRLEKIKQQRGGAPVAANRNEPVLSSFKADRYSRRYDANRDGVINGKEFTRYMKAAYRELTKRGRIRARSEGLKKLDVNGNGYIEGVEAGALRKLAYPR